MWILGASLGVLAYTVASCTQISQLFFFFLVHLLEIYPVRVIHRSTALSVEQPDELPGREIRVSWKI